MIAPMHCQCGCGLPVNPGRYKGRARRFIHGHNRRLNFTPEGHYVNLGGKHEHVLVAEGVLGKPLPQRAEVHHVDGDRQDNANRNLVICQDRAYHMLLHQRQRALEACGRAHWRKCVHCKHYDDPERLAISGKQIYHPKCVNEYNRTKRNNRLGRMPTSATCRECGFEANGHKGLAIHFHKVHGQAVPA